MKLKLSGWSRRARPKLGELESTETRTAIEEYALNVSAPEVDADEKEQKKNYNDTVVRFKTMLHVPDEFCTRS
jgi:hypothetical protein